MKSTPTSHGQITVYEMVKDNKGHEHWVSYVPSKDLHKKPVSNDILKSNPFFYKYTDDAVKVEDIEEFHVTYRHEDYAFRDLLRSHSFSRSKKRKIAKKVFGKWRKDAEKNKEASKDKNDDILERIEDVKPYVVSKPLRNILIISFVLLCAILGTTSSLWTVFRANSSVLDFIATSIDSGLKKQDIFNVLAHLDFYILAVWFIYQPHYNYVSTAYRNSYNQAKHEIEKNYNLATNSLKERVDEAEAYYLKNLKHNKDFAPLSMEHVVSPYASLHELEGLTMQTLTNKAKETKSNKLYVVLEKGLALSGLVLFVLTFIFSLAVLVGSLIA